MPTTQAGPLLHTLIFVSIPLGVTFFTNAEIFLEDVVGILIGHEAHRDFSLGLRGNHGLGAIGDEPSGHAVNFERRTRPGAIENGISWLAGQTFDPTSVLR